MVFDVVVEVIIVDCECWIDMMIVEEFGFFKEICLLLLVGSVIFVVFFVVGVVLLVLFVVFGGVGWVVERFFLWSFVMMSVVFFMVGVVKVVVV